MKKAIKREQSANNVWALQRTNELRNIKTGFLFAAMLLCLAQTAAYAQTKPSSEKASESKTLYGAISPLSETQTFALDFPEKLQYWDKDAVSIGSGMKSVNTYPQQMKAKKAKKGETPDFTFTFVTPGIGNIEKGEPVDHPAGGKVVEFSYTFPCALHVSDKDGKVVKIFELSSDENVMTVAVHPQFLTVDASVANSPVTGFMSKDPAKEVDEKIHDYLTRIEYNAYCVFIDQAKRVITNGYGYPKIMFAPVVLEVNKKEKAQYEELNGEIDKLKAAVNEVFQGPLNDDVRSRLMELGGYFASNYTESSSKDSKQLYAYNSSLAYLLGGDAEEAYKHFRAASLGQASTPHLTFINTYPIATETNHLYSTKDELEVGILPVYTVDDLRNMEKQALELAKQQELQLQNEAWRQELEAHNVKDAPGYVVTKNGEKIEGKINMKFIELTSTQILDMDIAKLVRVNPEGAKSRALKPKDVSYIVAGDKRFEPVTIAASAAIKVLGALSGNIGSDYFMEVVHKSGSCTAYYDPAIVSMESYYVKSHEEDKVQSYRTILRAGKASETFFGEVCPDLLARVKAKEFEPTKESLITFVNELAGCVK
ncbi:MAG: hypothetical protein LBB62_09955 [Proteiniphilum sp.]|jgi:hypothetical protein|nr:hypothetical protein [Proteiniphilum sp.]